jgi:hypothetical protein
MRQVVDGRWQKPIDNASEWSFDISYYKLKKNVRNHDRQVSHRGLKEGNDHLIDATIGNRTNRIIIRKTHAEAANHLEDGLERFDMPATLRQRRRASDEIAEHGAKGVIEIHRHGWGSSTSVSTQNAHNVMVERTLDGARQLGGVSGGDGIDSTGQFIQKSCKSTARRGRDYCPPGKKPRIPVGRGRSGCTHELERVSHSCLLLRGNVIQSIQSDASSRLLQLGGGYDV